MKIRGFLTPCKSYGFGDAAEEIIRLKRLEAAKDFISSVHMAYKYQRTSQKFRGDFFANIGWMGSYLRNKQQFIKFSGIWSWLVT